MNIQRAFWQNWPMIREGLKTGITEGLLPGSLAGLALSLATANPASFIAATLIGTGSATGRFIAKVEAGQELLNLQHIKYTDDKGNVHDLPDGIKKTISVIVGTAVSALELSQVDTLFLDNPVTVGVAMAGEKILKKLFTKGVADKLIRNSVVKFAKTLASKSVVEVGQELSQQLISDFGVLIARVANDEKIDTKNAGQVLKQYYGLAIDTLLLSTLFGFAPSALEVRGIKIDAKHSIDKLVKEHLKNFDPEKQSVKDLIDKIKATDEWQEISRRYKNKTTAKISETAQLITKLQDSKEKIFTGNLAELREEDIKQQLDREWEDYKAKNVIKDEEKERAKFEAKRRKELEALAPITEDEIKEQYKDYVKQYKELGLGDQVPSIEEFTKMISDPISDIRIYSLKSSQKHLSMFNDVLSKLKELVENEDSPRIVKKMVNEIEGLIKESNENLGENISVRDLSLITKNEIEELDRRIKDLRQELVRKNIDEEYKAKLRERLTEIRREKYDKEMMLDNYDSLLTQTFKNFYRYYQYARTVKERVQRLYEHLKESKYYDSRMDSYQVAKELLSDPAFRKAVGLNKTRKFYRTLKMSEAEFERYIKLAIQAGYFSGGKAKRLELLNTWILNKNKSSYPRLLRNVINENVKSILQTETKNISKRRADQIETIKKFFKDFKLTKDKVAELKGMIEAATQDDEFNWRVLANSIVDLQLEPLTVGGVKNLIEIRNYVDFLRFIGKKELEELKEPQYLLKESLKDAALETLGEKRNEHVKGSALYKDNLKWYKKLSSGLKIFNMMPAEWAKRIGGEKWVDVFVKQKLLTRIKEIQNEQRRSALVRGLIEDLGVSPDIFFETRVIDGKEYQVQDLMFYYLGRENELTREALVKSNGIPAEFLDSVHEHLTEEERLIAEEIAEDFQSVYPRLSNAYEEMTGRRLGYQRNWVPQIRELALENNSNLEESLVNIMLLGVDIQRTGVYDTFTNKRIGGVAPIRTDLYGLWRDVTPKQEHYIESAKLVAVMKRTINDAEVRNAIRQTYGQSWIKDIEKYINDFASPHSLHATDFLSRVIRWVKEGSIVGALALNIPVLMRMPVSIVFYPMRSGIPHFFSAVNQFRKAPRELYNFVKDRDPATIRSGTEYDFMNMRSKSDLLKLKDNITKGVLSPIGFIDKITKVIGWKAVYDSVLEETGNEYKAIKEARYWTDLTQPSSDKTTLPTMFRSNEILSLMNLFTQQPVKIFNLLHYEITGMIKEGDYGGAFLGLMGVSTSFALMWMISNRRLPDKWEDYAEMFLGGYLSTYPIIGKALVALTRSQFPQHPSYVEIAKPFIETFMNKSYKSKEAREKLALDYLKSLAIMTKMPYIGAYRVIKSVEDSDLRYFFFGGLPTK